jgi:hypothetical protein
LRYDPNTTLLEFEFANPIDGDADNSPFEPASTLPPLTGHPAITSRETEIFLPPRFVQAYQTPSITGPFSIVLSDGSWTVDQDRQVLIWTHTDDTQGAKHSIKMRIRRIEDEGVGIAMVALYVLLALIAVIAAFVLNARS